MVIFYAAVLLCHAMNGIISNVTAIDHLLTESIFWERDIVAKERRHKQNRPLNCIQKAIYYR